MMKKFVKLIMVTEENNNKYYNMSYDGTSPTFDIEYGRVEKTSIKETYPIGLWHKKYKEKIKKGYQDVTELVAVITDAKNTSKPLNIKGEALVVNFFKTMLSYRDGLVKTTYSVKASQVTKTQLEKAQSILDELSNNSEKLSDSDKNSLLIQLYTVIPRNMANVKQHLLPNVVFSDVIGKEQDNLDAIASQVIQEITPKESRRNSDLFKSLGITVKQSINHPEIDYLLEQQFRARVKTIFEINKPKEDKILHEYLSKQNNQDTKFLIHGTRCSSVVSIIEQGLKIRPSGAFHFSGKAYGNGIYFSETMAKSLGYTGYDKDKVIFVYEVHVGNPFKYEGWYRGNSFDLNLKELNSRGFNSTYVYAGNGLLNSEIIVYTEQQCSLRYIIHLQ
jgi:poly [ADP-ribose] polymerase 2/3/4